MRSLHDERPSSRVLPWRVAILCESDAATALEGSIQSFGMIDGSAPGAGADKIAEVASTQRAKQRPGLA